MKRIILVFGIAILLFVLTAEESFGRIDSLRTVVIDAGHGGHDPGAIGKVAREKEIALKIALKLGSYIEQNIPGVKVIYTRKTDVFIELYRRAEIANQAGADLFISIHCNAAKSVKAYGTETFAMGLHKSAANLEVARKENASILLEDNYEIQYEGFDPNSAEAYTLFSLFQNAYLDQSLNLASKIQYQFRERAGRHDRGVKQAGFLVLWRTSMPGILVESGFLSNADEENFLNSEKGQDYIASALFRAFRDYKLEVDKDAGEYARIYGASSHQSRPVKDPGLETKVKPVPQPVNTQADPVSSQGDTNREPEVFFSVQFLSSSDPRELSDPVFSGLEGVWSYHHNSMYKYVIGKEVNLQRAVELQSSIQQKGFSDAFLVAFNNGTRIPVKDATVLISNSK